MENIKVSRIALAGLRRNQGINVVARRISSFDV